MGNGHPYSCRHKPRIDSIREVDAICQIPSTLTACPADIAFVIMNSAGAKLSGIEGTAWPFLATP